jgi:glycosyltransferase involved in cell wall biosynthesis
MKIGFFTDRYYPQVDGVAVSVDIFAKELIKLGHEVTVFAPKAAKKKSGEEDPSYVVRFKSFPSIWYEDHRDTMPFNPATIKKVKQKDLDIIHIHTPAQVGMLGLRVAKEDNIPTVVTHHTDIDQYAKIYKKIMLGILVGILLGPALIKSKEHYRNILPNLKPNKSFKKWNRKLIVESVGLFYQNCDAVIVPSVKMEKSLTDYGKFNNIKVLPTGIGLDEAKAETDFDPRTKFKIKPDAPLLLFVGRLGKEKNIQLIIKSMPKILAQNPEARLLIVGDGPYAEELQTIVKNLRLTKNVIFAGMLDRPKTFACFRAADIFCFASMTDTQGLVLNEAAIESKPIVFLDHEISPLAQDGKTGIQAKNTTSSFANACLKLINDKKLAAKYGLAANKLALDISIEKQSKKLIELYKEIS